jgi:adenylate cyclase
LPNSQDVPLFIIARYSDVLILGIIIAIYALPLSFRLLWTTGAACAAMWVGGIVYTFVKFGRGQLFWGPMGPGAPERISEPGTLFPDYLILQVLLIFCFTGFVALLTLAAHRYLTARVVAERRAVSLLRYFPPGLGERARQADALAPVRRRVAVLFVSELAAPAYTAQAFSTLSKHYHDVEASVFAHDGVIDRFTGGPIMATFGALADEPDAVERAYACASALGPQGRVVALHLGEAVCGAIGEGGLTAFSVVGDVVHVARRILDEAQRRSLSLVASGEAAEALTAGGSSRQLTRLGSFVPRGREAEVALWAAPEPAHG